MFFVLFCVGGVLEGGGGVFSDLNVICHLLHMPQAVVSLLSIFFKSLHANTDGRNTISVTGI